MLKILIFAVTFFVASAGLAQGRLEVAIEGIQVPAGKIYIALFDNADNFLKRESHKRVISAKADPVTAIFEKLRPGVYAISVFHDRNGNGKLDSNRLGIPKEGFAFGNNAMGFFGPPTFQKAGITIQNSDVWHVVILKHF